MAQAFIDEIKGALSSIEHAFQSAEAEFEAYVTAHGGITAVISSMQAQVATAVEALTTIGALVGLPAADIALIQRVYAALSSVTTIVSKVQATLPANTSATTVVVAGVAAASVAASTGTLISASK